MAMSSRRSTCAVLAVVLAAGLLWLPPGAGAQTPAGPTVDSVQQGDKSLTVAWSAPSTVSVDDITSFDIRYIDSGEDASISTNWTEISGAWTPGSGPLLHLIDGLDNDTEYSVAVRLTTTSTSDWSPSVAATPADHGATWAAATSFSLGTPVGGEIESVGDVDFLTFTLTDTFDTTDLYIYTTGDTELTGQLYRTATTPHATGIAAPFVTSENNFLLFSVLGAGTYSVRISGKGAATGAYVLHSHVLKDNSSRWSPTRIELNSTTFAKLIRGSFGYDYFRFTLDAETDVSIRSEGLVVDRAIAAEGGQIWDLSAEVTDATGTVVARSNRRNQNPDGYLGEHFGNEMPFLIVERLPAGTYTIRVHATHVLDTHKPYALLLYEVDEPGSTRGTAAPLAVGGFGAGRIETSADVDYFELDVQEKSLVAVRATNLDPGGAALNIELLDNVGSTLGAPSFRETGPANGPAKLVSARTLNPGTYYLRVDTAGFDPDGGESATGAYAVTAYEPRLYAELLDKCDALPVGIADPLYGCQWHLNATGQLGSTADEDINITGAWATSLGSGVVVAVIDEGVDLSHEDLAPNADSANSVRYRERAGLAPIGNLRHGTRVAGLLAAAGNDAGVRGVAPEATIISRDMLRYQTLATYVHAMAHDAASIGVSNNSWNAISGPHAKRVPRVWELAVEQGLTDGDGGRGTFYVFGAGNGHAKGDNANLDEYVNFYGVTAVCAVGPDGVRSTYSETGANLWVCAPSSSAPSSGDGVVTTDQHTSYTDRAGGTSMAAPQVSGVAAVLRGVNPALTWRDLKLILAGSARKNDPTDTSWLDGAAKYEDATVSYEFSHDYGFGVVDASAAADLADGWTNVPALKSEAASWSGAALSVPDNSSTVSQSVEMGTDVGFVEFVQVDVELDAARFRDLKMELVSPSGSVSELMTPSFEEGGGLFSADGAYRFGTARHLGEDPSGTWTLRVTDRRSGGGAVTLAGWTVTVFGHRAAPSAPAITGIDGGADPLLGSTITVTWDAPVNEGSSSVTAYDVRYILSTGDGSVPANWTVIDNAWTSGPLQETITGLSTGVDYDIAVRAVNSAGDGPWSASVSGAVGSARHAPHFPVTELGERTVEENSPVGSDVGIPFEATDDDGDGLTYALSGQDVYAFELDSATGQLTTAAEFDYELGSEYRIAVAVSDGTGLGDRIDVTVSVADVDEAPSLSGQANHERTEVLDDHRRDMVYIARDPEGAVPQWSLSGPDAALFELIDTGLAPINEVRYGPHGELRFLSPPNYEDADDADADRSYEITVTASDGSQSTSMDVTIELKDHPTEPVVITGPSEISFAENDVGVVALYDAVDHEYGVKGWATDFHVIGPDWLEFSVHQGLLKFHTPPDYENPRDVRCTNQFNQYCSSFYVGEDVHRNDNVYEVRVWAREPEGLMGVFRWYKSHRVTVTVTDVEEEGWVALSTRQPVAGTALDADLSDPDGSLSGVTWEWQRSSDGSVWSTISGATASTYTPTTADDLDQLLRAVASYTDGNGPSKSATSAATFAVLDAAPANQQPVFAPGAGVTIVSAELSRGNVGSPVAATQGDSDSLTYTLGGTDASSFEIDSATGQLSFAAHGGLNYENPADDDVDNSYELEVSVSDAKDADGSADTAIDDTVAVTVIITDVDELPTITIDVLPTTLTVVDEYGESEDEVVNLVDHPENARQRIATVTVDDPEGREIRYAITDSLWWGNYPDYKLPSGATRFTVDSNGEVYFRVAPDYENPEDTNSDLSGDGGNIYVFDVRVADGNFRRVNPLNRRQPFVPFAVRVTDVNEPPHLVADAPDTPLSGVLNDAVPQPVPENSAGVLLTPSAVDPEHDFDPASAPLQWELGTNGGDENAFVIDPSTGQLQFVTPPDVENPGDSDSDNVYAVELSVSDGEYEDSAFVKYAVTDVNEPPELSGLASFAVDEGFSGVIGRFAGSDPEGLVDIVLSLSGDDAGAFELSATGDLSFDAAPDFESPADGGRNNVYELTVVGSDGTNSSSLDVTVTVTNVDEDGEVTLSNNQPQEDAQLTATLTDPDGSVTGTSWTWHRSPNQSTWTLISGANSRSYTPVSGDLNQWLRATVSYADGHGSSKSAQAESANSVRAKPVVNQAPAFPTNETGRRSIAENTPAPADVGAPIAAQDPNVGDTLTYALSGIDAGSFDIDATGQLSATVEFDRETKSQYRLTVTAKDSSNLSDSINVIVTVTDVNEAPTLSGPTAVNYAENATGRIGQFTASDPESGSLQWSLEGPDRALFSLVAVGSGRRSLGFAAPPDFETARDIGGDNTYEVTVKVSDGGESTSIGVRVNVTAVDEPPVVRGSATVDHPENTVPVGNYSAADPEGAAVTWTLSGTDAAMFVLDTSVQGSDYRAALRFASAPDFEDPSDVGGDGTYEVTLTASSAGADTSLTVRVRLSNEDDPGSIEFSGALPVQGTALVAQLTDPDGGVSAEVWTWQRSTDGNSWTQIAGATSNSYTPTAEDVDHWLRATVSYSDRHGGSKSAQNQSAFEVDEADDDVVIVVTRTTSQTGSGGGGGGSSDLDVGVATLVIANGWSAPDVGVASVLAARDPDAVVLYTAGGELSAETASLMREALPAEVVIVGGIAAVSRDVLTQARTASPDSDISRVAGADRADTAAGVARRILGTPASAGPLTVVVANGWSPPDIGAAAAVAARSRRSVVLYTGRDHLPDPSASVLRDYEVTRVVLIGGTAAISASAEDAISAAAGSDADVSRLMGADRVDTAAQAARRVLGNPAGAPAGVTLVVANGWSPPDVGVAAALAASTDNAAVAYTESGRLSDATAALVRDYRPASVIIIGGRAAVADSVRTLLTDTAPPSASVRRITGSTRVATAANTARRILADR